MLVQPGSSLFLLHRYLTVKGGGLDAICYSLAVPIPHVRYFVWRPLSSLSHSEPPRNLGLSFSCRLHFINILVTRRICSRRLPQRTAVSRTSFSVFQTVRISISSLHFLSLRFLRFRNAISYTIFHILRFSVPFMMNNPPPTHPLHSHHVLLRRALSTQFLLIGVRLSKPVARFHCWTYVYISFLWKLLPRIASQSHLARIKEHVCSPISRGYPRQWPVTSRPGDAPTQFVARI